MAHGGYCEKCGVGIQELGQQGFSQRNNIANLLENGDREHAYGQ